MTAHLNPYLTFNGQARAAIAFYQSVFGGDVSITTFKEGGMASAPATEEQIMHAQLEAPNDFWLMAADTPPDMPFTVGNNISVSLFGDDETLLRGHWNRLSEGATIMMPLEKAPWGDTFGMLVDKFGIPWMVNIGGA